MSDAYDSPLHAGDVTVGDTGPAVVVEELERADFVKYAGASGDFNPIHYDEPYAKRQGHPSVFGQGMLTAGVAAHAAADWFGLAAIDRFRTRFTAQVWPGDTITATGEVTAVRDESVVEADIVVRNQDDEAVLTGSVVATLPSRED